MRITFVSNFINHHQIPLCNALYAAEDVDFCFIQTQAMTDERLRGGWAVDERMFQYVRFYDREKEECKKRFLESEVVLLGWSMLPASLIEKRLKSHRLTFRISERIYKEGRFKAVSPRGLFTKYKEHIRYRKSPVYMLCADAYAAGDFHLIGAYPGKLLRWGYFPETRRQAPKKWITPDLKKKICWAGRMIDWKHPEYAVKAARAMRNKGYDFTLEMIGDGPLRKALEQFTIREGLMKEVLFRSTLTPYEVRAAMEASHMFLFTSNFLEGWGAVLNEAMNAGCAVVASAEAGSVPYLMTDKVNGFVYNNGRYDDFEACVLRLVNNEKTQIRLGNAACDTILDRWNAEVAAERLLSFSRTFLEKGEAAPFPDEGPMSAAPLLRGVSFRRTREEGMRQDHV